MVPVWRALVVQQDTVLAQAARCLDRFVKGDLSATETSIAMSEIQAKLSVTPEHVQEYQQCSTQSTYYKRMAARALQTGQSIPLARECWAQAAVHIDAAMQMQLDMLVSGEQRSPNSDHSRTLRWRQRLADQCVYIAEAVLGRAVEYFNEARGAEAGENNGRDPREAQMWRKAADYQVQTATLMFKVFVREKVFDPTRTYHITRDSEAVGELEAAGKVFARSAEYLFLAFKHRTLLDVDTSQNGVHVAMLYEHLVDILPFGLDATTNGSTRSSPLSAYWCTERVRCNVRGCYHSARISV